MNMKNFPEGPRSMDDVRPPEKLAEKDPLVGYEPEEMDALVLKNGVRVGIARISVEEGRTMVKYWARLPDEKEGHPFTKTKEEFLQFLSNVGVEKKMEAEDQMNKILGSE